MARGDWTRHGLAVAGTILVLDQIVKWLILEHVFGVSGPAAPIVRAFPMIEVTPFFNLVLVWNRGVSFGLFSHDAEAMRWVLVGVALIITVALLIWQRRAERPFLAVSVGLVIGGAIGNVIDRLRFGAVADFLDFHVFGYHWPAFNVADSAISIGVVLLLYDGLFGRQGDPSARGTRSGGRMPGDRTAL